MQNAWLMFFVLLMMGFFTIADSWWKVFEGNGAVD
jgi:hypothetical protein